MTSKITAIGKSILILALTGLAVYQLSQLWFVNITDRNLLLYIEARFAPSTPDDIYLFARPFRIVTGNGNGYFNQYLNQIDLHEAWANGNPIIESAISNANFVGQNPIDSSILEGRPVAVYEYAFPMSIDIFALALGIRGDTVLETAGMINFRQIALLPPEDNTGQFAIIFFCEDYAWEFALRNPGNFHIPPATQDRIYFTIHQGDNIYFQPAAPHDFAFNPLLIINPYLTILGAHDIRHIGAMIHPFFSNPATINQSVSGEGIFTFSNQNTMVRYHINNVIEYTSFRPIGVPTALGFAGDFSAAIAFMASDSFITNEFYLAGYEAHGRGYLFRFNYAINNYQIFFPEPWPTSPSCTDPLLSPIEIFVEQGRVVRYRRLAHNFEIESNQYVVLLPGVIPTYREDPFMVGFPIIIGQQASQLEASGE